MPRLVEIGPGEAVCIATGGRLFATADSFCDFEAVALNDSEGNEVAGLAWTDNVPTLTIPQAAGGYRRFGIVGGGPSEFTTGRRPRRRAVKMASAPGSLKPSPGKLSAWLTRPAGVSPASHAITTDSQRLSA